MKILGNSKCIMQYNPSDKCGFVITGDDLTDVFNEPRCYNKTARSHKKAWAALTAKWTDQTTMYEACQILTDNGVKMHTYCSMD